MDNPYTALQIWEGKNMTRALVATLCALSIAGLSATATFADDTDTTKDANVSGESAATETAPKESKASKKSKKLKIVTFERLKSLIS